MQIEPYLFFYGRCEEALTFYKEKLGAEITFMIRNSEAPEDMRIEGELGKRIMHATFKLGHSTIMASDGKPQQSPEKHTGFSLSIAFDALGPAEKCFNALAQGGQIAFAWQPTFWAKGFGMVIDKFGIPWMVNVEKPHEGK